MVRRDLAAETKHVGVIVSSAALGIDLVVDQGGPDAGDLVRGNGDADAVAAKENAAIGITVGNGAAHEVRAVRIIARLVAAFPEDGHFATCGL